MLHSFFSIRARLKTLKQNILIISITYHKDKSDTHKNIAVISFTTIRQTHRLGIIIQLRYFSTNESYCTKLGHSFSLSGQNIKQIFKSYGKLSRSNSDNILQKLYSIHSKKIMKQMYHKHNNIYLPRCHKQPSNNQNRAKDASLLY